MTRRELAVTEGGIGRLRFACAVSVVLLAAGSPGGVQGQGVRGWASTSVQYTGLRPIRGDTVSIDRVEEGPDGSLSFEGRPVTCLPGLPCTFYRPEARTDATSGVQDLALTAWGLGGRGISATVLLRGRARLAGDLVWPRSDDEFDALLAYVQYDRDRWRARVGRQESLSGLGARSYDGVSARWVGSDALSVDGFAGRSLARGLSEPRDEALAGLEDFLIDRGALIFGAAASWRPRLETTASVRYQREIYSNRSAVISERSSFDLSTSALRPMRIDAAVDYDWAFGRVGKGHLRLTLREPESDWAFGGTLRRYRPYFDLSTIWGFFSPVAYHEASAQVQWMGSERFNLRAEGGWRRYEPTDAPVIFDPLEDDGWHGELGGVVTLGPELSLDAEYRMDWGVGAYLSAGDAALRWAATPELDLALTATAFQQFQEFRVGEGRVWGIGGTGYWRVRPGMELGAGFASYSLTGDGRSVPDPWDQLRAWSSFRLTFGDDAAGSPPRFRR